MDGCSEAMRASSYNVVFEGDGAWMAFNTLSGAFALFDEAACQLLDAGAAAADAGADAADASASAADASAKDPLADPNALDGLSRQERADTCAVLAQGGFLVDESFDERAFLHERFLQDMNETGFLSLCLAPTMACNLRCVYCYEDHEPVRMTPEVEQAVMRFVERRYEACPFTLFEVQWYGGEPVLEIDLIERMGKRFMAWCARRGVAYHSFMVTNATLIGEAEAARLSAAGVVDVMPTLDGCAPVHDCRRVMAGGEGSYALTRAGIAACRAVGISVGVNCNLDRANVADYQKLREDLAREGVDIYASHLRNYGNWCAGAGIERDRSRGACASAAITSADLFKSRAEYARQLFELYAQTTPSAASLVASLAPKRSFCRGKMASYFVVDPEGNVCRCDGFMRDPSRVLFNVCDEQCPVFVPEKKSFFEKNERCRTCSVAPQCLGDCDWEWSMFDENCHALRYTLKSYVALLGERVVEEGYAPCAADDAGHVHLYLSGQDVFERYAEPFSPMCAGVVAS